MVMLGLLWMALPMLLFPMAQLRINSAVAGMINGAIPLTATAWAVLLHQRAPGRIQLCGIGIGFAGIIAIVWPQVTGGRTTTVGIALVVFAVVLDGLSANIAAPLQRRHGAPSVLLRAQLAAFVFVAPFGPWGLPRSHWALGPMLAMLPLGVLCTGLAFVFMTNLIGRVGGPRGSLPTYFVPVVATVLGALVLQERIALSASVGTCLVLFGAGLVSRPDGRGRGQGG